MANAVATAASTALPPAFKTDTPTSAAGDDAHTTMPLRASTALGGVGGVSPGAGRMSGMRTRTAASNAAMRVGVAVIAGNSGGREGEAPAEPRAPGSAG